MGLMGVHGKGPAAMDGIYGTISGAPTVRAEFNLADLPAIPGYYSVQLRGRNAYSNADTAVYIMLAVASAATAAVSPANTWALASAAGLFVPLSSTYGSTETLVSASVSGGKITIVFYTGKSAAGYQIDSLNQNSFALMQKIELPS